MRKPLVIVAIVSLLCSYACAPMTDAREPAPLRRRARSLRMQAAALRKDALEYSVLVENTEAELQMQQVKLDVMLQIRAEEAENVERLGTEVGSLDPQDAEGIAAVLKRHEVAMANADAQVTGESAKIRRLNQQLEDQRWLYNNYLYRANEKEEKARQLEERAEIP